MTKHGRAKTPLGNPYPLRYSTEVAMEVAMAMAASKLPKVEVLRRAIAAGLPMVKKQFAPQIRKSTRARRAQKTS